MRLLGRLLVLLGALGLVAAVMWWLQFYQQVASVIGAKGSAPPIECLFQSNGDCGLVSGAASLLGGTPYNPLLLWFSGALLAIGFMVWGVGSGLLDRYEPASEPQAAPLPPPETKAAIPVLAEHVDRARPQRWLLAPIAAALVVLGGISTMNWDRWAGGSSHPSPGVGESSTSAAVVTAVQEVGEPFDLKTTNPSAFKAIQDIVPADLRNVKWVFELNGTAPPMKLVTVAGMPYLAGSVCKTHFCEGNTFVFLVAVDGSRATAMLKSADLYSGKAVEFGSPLAGDRAALSQMISDF